MRSTAASHWNAQLLEQNYARWQADPNSVDAQWRAFFEGFELGYVLTDGQVSRREVAKAIAALPAPEAPAMEAEVVVSDVRDTVPAAPAAPAGPVVDLPFQLKVEAAIRAFREIGHTLAQTDPLGQVIPQQPLLDNAGLGFAESDLEREVGSDSFAGGQKMKLRELLATLHDIYCHHIGAEFMHISDPAQREFLRERIERNLARPKPEVPEQVNILRSLLEAELFERFLHTRYVGQKRFSVEGGESLLPLMETILEACPGNGVAEIVMGMAHRGRLSILANFLQKSLQTIFTEFTENYLPDMSHGDGDVKYHLGYETVRKVGDANVGIRLAANPSHLEIVNAVVMGKARARQRIHNDTEKRRKVLPLLIHGDAAFIGQGVVAEVLNMSQLQGYTTGGTLHIVVNNQIGFTTLPTDGRSSNYCTDIAKIVEAPVFHVNGDNPEAVCAVAKIAVEYRQAFGRDVVIDLICYRKYGHNEADEPAFTQPDMYAKINARPPIAKLYAGDLVTRGRMTEEQVAALRSELENLLETNYQAAKAALAANGGHGEQRKFSGSTAVFQPPYSFDPVNTAITPQVIARIGHALTRVPDGFSVYPKLKKTLIERRTQVFQTGVGFNWADGEALAIGSLLLEGTPVRLSGQDSRRGTFSHRLSVLYDAQSRERYIPINHIVDGQEKFCVYNSPLSEAGVLGFDYGYSMDYPTMLTLWEAQFGDFANGAQVVIDQFIAAAESKWARPSGIVLLLPHGYEGQGPEHSSARLERFLQLCAEENMQVCNVTTPAQYFHLLRRQMMRAFRKPLVLMSPKSLLRADTALSRADDFLTGTFQEVVETPAAVGAAKATKVILCSGKVYYDLLAKREAAGVQDVALIRLEQLYPLHVEKMRAILAPYRSARKWVWCQEEPKNMGAWSYISPRLAEVMPSPQAIYYVGRKASASPAVGSLARHKIEQKEIVEKAFAL
ncbi:MAG: 2-oxoglutarate dehydrogenase E1 component [Verrucomicrobia bacterium]|nr:2-oxoglutarate dehydrogenase E1 component [Verrucomicrobiota bacterium]